MAKQGVENKTKPHWRLLADAEVGQSSHDKWKSSKPQGKSKEISAEIDAVGTTVKEKTNTWNKSCRGAPRENRNFTRWLNRQHSTKGKNKKTEACSRTYYSNFKKKERRRKRLVGSSKPFLLKHVCCSFRTVRFRVSLCAD